MLCAFINEWPVVQISYLSVSLRAWLYRPNTRTSVRLLGPCFKTGRLSALCHLCSKTAPPEHAALGASSLRSAALKQKSPRARNAQCWFLPRATPKRFPFGNFTHYLTLFSKSFSSFPHGTCSLSVSCLYLALDGIYHPFWPAFPNKPTLGVMLHVSQQPPTGLSPSMAHRSR